MKLSKRGADLVKAFESCLQPNGLGKFRAYVCPAGKLTIGWGHTNDHGRSFDGSSMWTKAECDAAFEEDMRGFEAAVGRLARVPLTQTQFDALVSFAYNCGEGALAGSTLLRKLNRSDYDGAAREFGKWVMGGNPKKTFAGLVRRRASESLLFQNIPDYDYDGKADAGYVRGFDNPEPAGMPQDVAPPDPPKSMASSKSGNTAIGIGIGTAAEMGAKINEHLDKAAEVKERAEQLGVKLPVFDLSTFLSSLAADSTVLILAAIIAGVIFLWWDRRRKLHEEHV